MGTPLQDGANVYAPIKHDPFADAVRPIAIGLQIAWLLIVAPPDVQRAWLR